MAALEGFLDLVSVLSTDLFVCFVSVLLADFETTVFLALVKVLVDDLLAAVEGVGEVSLISLWW